MMHSDGITNDREMAPGLVDLVWFLVWVFFLAVFGSGFGVGLFGGFVFGGVLLVWLGSSLSFSPSSSSVSFLSMMTWAAHTDVRTRGKIKGNEAAANRQQTGKKRPAPAPPLGARESLRESKQHDYCWGNRIGPQFSRPFQSPTLASSILPPPAHGSTCASSKTRS